MHHQRQEHFLDFLICYQDLFFAVFILSYSLSGNSGVRPLGVRRAVDRWRATLYAICLSVVPRWCTVSPVTEDPVYR